MNDTPKPKYGPPEPRPEAPERLRRKYVFAPHCPKCGTPLVRDPEIGTLFCPVKDCDYGETK
jgi:uncharacterized Zn finger protein (UPF0148 family)